MKNDIFPLISTIILPKMLTLRSLVHIETSAGIYWNSRVAPKFQEEKTIHVS